MTLPLAGAIGGAAGIGTGLIGSKIYSKITGKPAGAPASLAHILTNDKLDKHAKAEVIKEQMADSINYTGKALGVATVAAGATAIATGCSNKIAGYAQKASAKAGELLSNVAVKGKDLKSLLVLICPSSYSPNKSSYELLPLLPGILIYLKYKIRCFLLDYLSLLIYAHLHISHQILFASFFSLLQSLS